MRSSTTATVCMGFLATLLFASGARAQTGDPDVRNFEPFVMIVVDSSGSMEWVPNCKCTTLGCDECLPHCELSNVAGEPPLAKKNRWSVLLEALTGKFKNFECTPLKRTLANGMTYDIGYNKDYHQPWYCGGSACPYPGPSIQENNGLLDNYAGGLRFGLMTFDGQTSYRGAPPIVESSLWDKDLSEGANGSFSYGGSKRVHYPTCTTDYVMDTGVRGPKADEGGLITLDSTACATPPCDMYELNDAIQSSLLRTRTFGGTPIAAALDDLEYHFKNDMNDTYKACRKRYAVLITDGYPDDDYRTYPPPGCNCANTGGCGMGEPEAAMHCPYPTAPEAAYNLVHGTTTQPKSMEQLFVVGMSIGDSSAKTLLNAVASSGGSPKVDGNEAFFPDDPAKLSATLDSLFTSFTDPVSRSVPAFATGLSSVQYQISAGFQTAQSRPVGGIAQPWTGLIERRRFDCSTTGAPALSATAGDKFHEVLNAMDVNKRLLWTALPSDLNKLQDPIDSSVCGSGGCTVSEIKDLTGTHFNLSDTTKVTELIDWMYGKAGTVRATRRLGDIYHSSPTVVGIPTDDPGDDSYTLFRQSPAVVVRPLVMYVGTNDGILHAFSVEDYPQGSITTSVYGTYKAGEELWGFVPPYQLRTLKDQLPQHKLGMDGTPVVKDVYFSKNTTASAADYHTVLITGMRGGGTGYVALDVTNPVKPKFLWQFTHSDMAYTYGQAEIVQVKYEKVTGTPTVRAVAILPGGRGRKASVLPPTAMPDCNTSTMTTQAKQTSGSTPTRFKTLTTPDGTAQLLDHRSDVPCWERAGRSLFFVDVETGELIKELDSTIFPSTVTGTPTAYPDTVGTVADKGFVMDADGVLWRIDMTSTDPKPTNKRGGWTARPFHDLYWDMKPNEGQTTYERPILSLDDKHRMIVLVGTGDTDNFEDPSAMNRVVSLTEIDGSGGSGDIEAFQAALNWELRSSDENTFGFVESEMVTGTMALFEGQLFMASFASRVSKSNSCAYGRGRLWALDYRERDTTHVNSRGTNAPMTAYPTYGPRLLGTSSSISGDSDSGASLFNITIDKAEENLLIQGLGTYQRASCQSSGIGLDTYFAPNLVKIQQSAPPAIWLVAQASSTNAARKRAGSSLGSLEMQVARPMSFSRVVSWAGTID